MMVHWIYWHVCPLVWAPSVVAVIGEVLDNPCRNLSIWTAGGNVVWPLSEVFWLAGRMALSCLGAGISTSSVIVASVSISSEGGRGVGARFLPGGCLSGGPDLPRSMGGRSGRGEGSI